MALRLLSIAFVALLIRPACADSVVDLATRAQQEMSSGSFDRALRQIDAAFKLIWHASPLRFDDVALVIGESGYGDYTERSNRVFLQHEKLSVYVQPIGFRNSFSSGLYTTSFRVDLVIRNSDQFVISEARDMFSIDSSSRENRREFAMTLAFEVPYVPPGHYTADFNVRDINSGKSNSFKVDFEVNERTVSVPAQPKSEPLASTEVADPVPTPDIEEIVPLCESAEAVEAIKGAIEDNAVSGILTLKLLYLEDQRERRYDASGQARFCSGKLVTNAGEEFITYKLYVRRQEPGTFYVQID